MRTPTAQMIVDAATLINGADHLLGNTSFESQLSAKDCYDLVDKLERARNLLLVVGDRKHKDELDKIPLDEGVPF